MTTTTTRKLPLPALAALATAAFTTVLTEALPAGVLPGMSASLRVSEAATGQLVTVYALGTALTAIPLAAATSGWPRKRLLLTGVAGFALANTVTAVSSVFAVTLAARFVAGVAAGVVWALLAGHARRIAPEGLAGKALAVVMTGIPVALSLGVPAGTFAAEWVGWRPVFATMTVLAVVLLGWIGAVVPDLPGRRGEGASVRAALRVPGVGAVLVVTLTVVLAYAVLYTYVAALLRHLGLGDRVDVALLVFGIASVAGIAVVGTWVDRRLRLLTLGAVVLFAVAATMLATGVWVYAAIALWGLAFGSVPTLTQTAAAVAGGAHADAAQAALVTLWNAAMAAGGVLGGLILDHGGPTAFPVAALVLLVPAFLAALNRNAFPPPERRT
ncbi:MFS transporter [Actinosynnema sp. NPDC020468]|uniref:MFS transporter n=1 Tax=Actinosynnema sp. NPDC020468 TaxID=3154488 RepID=UPI0033F66B29